MVKRPINRLLSNLAKFLDKRRNYSQVENFLSKG